MGWTTNEESIEVISKESVEDKNPKLYLKRAKVLAKGGLTEEAEEEYDKAIEYSGKKISYYFRKLLFCLDKQKYEKAIGVVFTVLWVIIWEKLRVLWGGLLVWGVSFVSLEYLMRIYVYQYYDYFTTLMGFVGSGIVVVAICRIFKIKCFKYIFSILVLLFASIICTFLGDGLFYIIIVLGMIVYGLLNILLLIVEICQSRADRKRNIEEI